MKQTCPAVWTTLKPMAKSKYQCAQFLNYLHTVCTLLSSEWVLNEHRVLCFSTVSEVRCWFTIPHLTHIYLLVSNLSVYLYAHGVLHAFWRSLAFTCQQLCDKYLGMLVLLLMVLIPVDKMKDEISVQMDSKVCGSRCSARTNILDNTVNWKNSSFWCIITRLLTREALGITILTLFNRTRHAHTAIKPDQAHINDRGPRMQLLSCKSKYTLKHSGF